MLCTMPCFGRKYLRKYKKSPQEDCGLFLFDANAINDDGTCFLAQLKMHK